MHHTSGVHSSLAHRSDRTQGRIRLWVSSLWGTAWLPLNLFKNIIWDFSGNLAVCMTTMHHLKRCCFPTSEAFAPSSDIVNDALGSDQIGCKERHHWNMFTNKCVCLYSWIRLVLFGQVLHKHTISTQESLRKKSKQTVVFESSFPHFICSVTCFICWQL